jgi:tetratricopeptide (TPR) repeat protein/transglutaminase-like putative cysteine protease
MSTYLCTSTLCLLLFLCLSLAFVRPAIAHPFPTHEARPDEKSLSKEAYVIEVLHSRLRYEADGKGSRELTVRVRIQSESATHEFGLLKFEYAASFESLDIDYVRVRKPDGNVVATPMTDVQDLDSAVSREAPMYTDQREKHVAVKALTVGDILEYHLVWTVHDPIAPGYFWLDDEFFHAGICLEERIELDVPTDLPIKIASGPVKPSVVEKAGRRLFTFQSSNLTRPEDDDIPAWEKNVGGQAPPPVQFSTFQSWEEVGKWFGALEAPQIKVTPAIQAKAEELTLNKGTELEKIRAIYDFVSLRFRYIGISLGLGRYTPHRADEVLANRYGDCKDKHTLFASLLAAVGIKAYPALISSSWKIDSAVPSPSLLDHVISAIPHGETFLFVDTTPELAGFGYLSGPLRNKLALVIPSTAPARLVKTPPDPPAPNSETFQMEASLDLQGTLEGKARIESRGDSEIALRSAFRVSPEDRWKDLVQSISGSLGFGGTVSDVHAEQPEVTADPFWVSYSYHRSDYSDWKERRISLPMPPIMLPKLSEKRKNSNDPLPLGSPIEVTYRAKLTLPKGTTAVLPPSVDLQRDFATYTAAYKLENGVLIGERHLKTRMREIPGSERGSYSEFADSLIEDQSKYMPLMGAVATSGSGALPGLTGHSDNAEAQHIYDEARESLALGAPRSAISALERALKLDPKWSDAWVLLGSAHMMADQFDPAVDAFRKAVFVDPSNTQGYRALAVALMSKHREADATKAWRDLLKVSPNDTQASANLRSLLLRNKNYAEALPLLQKALEENGGNARVHLELGQVLLHLGDEEKSIAHFQKALELDASTETFNSVAYSLAEANRRLPDALHYAEQAVEKTEEQSASARWEFMDSSNLGVMGDLAAQWDTLGWVKFLQGDYASASTYLESAWLLMQDPVIGDHLGQAYERLGNKRQAARTYAMVLSTLSPRSDPEFRQRITSKISSLSLPGAGATRDAAIELSSLRSYRVPQFKEWGSGYKSAEFGVAFTKGPTVQSVWFRSGAEELKDAADDISELKFHVSFPDGGPTRIVRLGILSCSEVSKGCTFVLIPVQQPRPSWLSTAPSLSIQ